MNTLVTSIFFFSALVISWSLFRLKHYGVAIASLVICVIYFFIPLIKIFNPSFTSGYFYYTNSNIFEVVCLSFIYLIILIFFYFIINQNSDRSKKVKLNFSYKKLSFDFYIFFLLAMIGVLYKFIYFDPISRDISVRGGGLLFVLGYAGYILPLIVAERKFLCSSLTTTDIVLGFISCVPAAVFFWLSGQRGGAIFPLFFIFGFLTFQRFSDLQKFFLSLALFPFLYVGNFLTGVLRQATFMKMELRSLLFNLQFNNLSLAFAHSELFAGLINKQNIGELDYFYNSFINWIPVKIVGEKGLTTGPVLASIFLSDVNLRYHSTSLTTGPLVEGYYYFGLAFFIISFFHAVALVYSHRYLTRGNLIPGIILLWLFSFQIFFDDLGGLINKLFIFCLLFFILKKIRIVMIKRKTVL